MIDFPTAWKVIRATKMEHHHPECSYRKENGAFLCDCAAMQAIKALDEILNEEKPDATKQE